MNPTNMFFTINVVAPVFLIILLGFILKKAKLINEEFTAIGSKVVFNIGLPCLIFIKLSQVDIKALINFKQIAFCYFGTILVYVIAWIGSKPFIKNGDDRGVFIQGCFRGNYAIIGIPLAYNLFGDAGLINSSILLIAVLLINNLFAVLALTIPPHKGYNLSLQKTFMKIVTNPLILAPMIALPFSYFRVGINPVIQNTFSHLANLTIPLALLSIGGSLKFINIKQTFKLAIIASITKIIIMPLILTILAIKIGFRGVDLASIYFLFTAPTALASYIMADSMGCNPKLASTIVILTTTMSVITISIGIFFLNIFGLF